MDEDWNNRTKDSVYDVMIRNTAWSRSISMAIVILYHVLHFIFTTIPLIAYVTGPVEKRILISAATYPWDFRKSPAYEFAYFVQYTESTMCFNLNALVEGLLAVMVTITNIRKLRLE